MIACMRIAAAVDEVGSVKARLWLIYLAGCSLAFERSSIAHLPDTGVEAPRAAPRACRRRAPTFTRSVESYENSAPIRRIIGTKSESSSR